MKFAGTLAITLTALLQVVQADFEVYRIGSSCSGLCGNAEGWQVYPEQANCDNDLGWHWNDSDDVSGSSGVRCKDDEDGCGRSDESDSANIEALEMHFGPKYHWSTSVNVFQLISSVRMNEHELIRCSVLQRSRWSAR
jgi:hypothetical protein